MKTSGYYIKSYDGLRGAFVPPVLMTHLGVFDFLYGGAFTHRIWLTISGHTALYGFFCLSGFLITTILLKEKEKCGDVSIKRFLIRRALRLLPPLILFYLVVALFMHQGLIVPQWVALACSVFYCFNFIPNKFWSNELSHTWSLSVEEQFYLLWPWLIKYLRSKIIYLICIGTVILSIVAIVVYPHISFSYQNETHTIASAFFEERFLLPAICPVLCGSVAALLFFYFNNKVISLIKLSVSVPLCILLMCCPMYFPSAILPFAFILQAAGLSIFILWITVFNNSIISRILQTNVLVLVGNMSYAIYIWQGLFLGTAPTSQKWFQQFPQNLALTMAVAACSYFIIEKPLMRYKQKYSNI
ncbi:MAG: acyltransferase [Bacteroidetes bacterium]|nr:acyltransferase [Bacteroidota bacterium]